MHGLEGCIQEGQRTFSLFGVTFPSVIRFPPLTSSLLLGIWQFVDTLLAQYYTSPDERTPANRNCVMSAIEDWIRGSGWTNLVAKIRKLESPLAVAMVSVKVPVEFQEELSTKVLFVAMV